MPEEQSSFRPELTPQSPDDPSSLQFSLSNDDTSPSRRLEPLPRITSQEDTTPSGVYRPVVSQLLPFATPPARDHGLGFRYMLGAAILLVCATLIVSLVVLIDQLGEPDTPTTESISITLQVDGNRRNFNTNATTIDELLRAESVELAPADRVTPGRNTVLETGMQVVVERARDVTVTVGDNVIIVSTTFDQPFDVLRAANIRVNPDDLVRVDGQDVGATDLIAWPLPVQDIVITRALPVRILDGDAVIDVNTTAKTVGDALFEEDIRLFLADTVQPSLNDPIEANMEIVIDRSRPITFIVDGGQIETRVNTQTVGDALIEAGVSLNGLDYSIPGEAVEVLPGMSVRIIRVTEEIVTEEEPILFETIYQADANATLDTTSVIQAGQNGLYERTIRVRYENGVEISRTVEEEGVTQLPVEQVIRYGTNVVVRTLDTPDGPVQYWRKYRVYATSYHPGSVGGSTTTATGDTLRKGIVGIDPSLISYGTNVYVEGYGVGLAADTGLKRSTPYWIDLGYSDEDFVGWSRWITVYILTPVPSNINYLPPAAERGGPIP